MTKTRAPLSIEQALQRIAGQLPGGVDDMARIADRVPGTVRAWMDPDRPEQVSVEAAIQLDLEYAAQGGVGRPIFEAYAAQLELGAAQKFELERRLHVYAHDVIKEGGEAHAAIVAATMPGASHTHRRIAFKEASEAYEKLRDILPLLQQGSRAAGEHAAAIDEGTETLAQAP